MPTTTQKLPIEVFKANGGTYKTRAAAKAGATRYINKFGLKKANLNVTIKSIDTVTFFAVLTEKRNYKEEVQQLTSILEMFSDLLDEKTIESLPLEIKEQLGFVTEEQIGNEVEGDIDAYFIEDNAKSDLTVPTNEFTEAELNEIAKIEEQFNLMGDCDELRKG